MTDSRYSSRNRRWRPRRPAKRVGRSSDSLRPPALPPSSAISQKSQVTTDNDRPEPLARASGKKEFVRRVTRAAENLQRMKRQSLVYLCGGLAAWAGGVILFLAPMTSSDMGMVINKSTLCLWSCVCLGGVLLCMHRRAEARIDALQEKEDERIALLGEITFALDRASPHVLELLKGVRSDRVRSEVLAKTLEISKNLKLNAGIKDLLARGLEFAKGLLAKKGDGES